MDPREKEYISIFKQYAEQIYDSLVRFDNVKQVYYAFELGKQFRRVCTIIGKGPRFLGMNQFLNVVRKKDREYIDYLKGLKRKYKGHPKVSESERPDSQKFKPLIEKFYLKVDQIDPIPEKPKNIEFNQETKNERQKRLFYEGKNWISKRMKLSFSSEEEKIISKYRKELTKEERKELKY